MRIGWLLTIVALTAVACGGSPTSTAAPPSAPAATGEQAGSAAGTGAGEGDGVAVPPPETAELRNQRGFAFPPAPGVPERAADPALVATIDGLFADLVNGVDVAAVEAIGASGDARSAWLLADLVRFLGFGEPREAALDAFQEVTGASFDDDPVAARSPWQSMSDHLIAWDLPALDGYRDWKAQLYLLVEPKWRPLFEDEDAAIDWRPLTWGGVLMDDRPLGTATPCPLGCIPALDDPAVTDAAGGDWYPDREIVFGVVVDGEARAYPKNIMEVHEMVNDTLGGRRLGIPYCTLCGSAQAYFTDSVPPGVEVPVLRTSGLLSRSNKVMFDLQTFSVFDTFTGEAVSGPLHDAGVVLEQTSVVASTWRAWKEAHPGTTIVAEDGGIGRSYPADPLRGRDDDGPIFPIGDVDPRLPASRRVLGIVEDGRAIAFPVAEAKFELDAGRPVELDGIVVGLDGDGLRAHRTDGGDVVGHEAFWFAWSQFNPDTLLWSPAAG